ncbi:GNAT family N-acetyltransferase [Bradyrhizobium sp. ISRA435]|nr:GNAT family N-acetyltransferase [Bradyrhizobium sp. ISRA435]
MADTDDLAIVELGVDDAPAGLALSTEARWNQNEADWQFFLSHGIVFGVRDGDHLIATAALLPYSGGNAWISMVLVTASWQRRGPRDPACGCLLGRGAAAEADDMA